MSRTRTLAVDTSHFDNVYLFDQRLALACTKKKEGMCGAFSNIFILSALSKKPLEEFKKPDYCELNSKASQLESRAIDHFRDGEDADAIAFHEMNLSTQTKVISADKTADTLKQSSAALLKYQTPTGDYHQLGFSRLFQKCVAHNPNQLTGVAECDLIYHYLQTVITNNHAENIKVDFIL
ncbi:MAG: hypothetical protein P4M12_08170 [Gammaproteobacteria bacterium]|nr:hypothetical protein [Gammaproteobacteria bacterium]